MRNAEVIRQWQILREVEACRTGVTIHELAGLADRLPRLRPHTMRVKEWKGTVVFLHEVAEGAAGRSWGVHVAELAGVPAPVVRRAGTLLTALEKHGGPLGAGAPLAALPLFASLEPPATDPPPLAETNPLADALADIDPDQMTPREALDALYRLKARFPIPAGEV